MLPRMLIWSNGGFIELLITSQFTSHNASRLRLEYSLFYLISKEIARSGLYESSKKKDPEWLDTNH